MDPQAPQDASLQGLYYYDDQNQYGLTYPSPVGYHPQPGQSPLVVHQPPHIQTQPVLQYHGGISMFAPGANHHPPYGSPPHGNLSLQTSASPPPSPSHLYDPISPSVSGSDTSAEGLYQHSNSSNNSPSSSRGSSLVHRQRSSHRYNPTPSPTSSTGRRSIRGRSQDSDELEDDMGINYRDNLASSRKEATRRQRIEAEQRRRDELRDGYAKLKDVLPVSNLKSSKVSLLERATNHIIALEKANQELQARIDELEAEASRLRALNEKMSLGAGDGLRPAILDLDSKPVAASHSEEHASTSEVHPHMSSSHIQGMHPPSHPSPSPSSGSTY